MTKKILIVDDDADILEIVTEEIQERGLEVSSALSGESALKMLNNDFDLIITDQTMPNGMSGEDLIKEIREQNLSMPIYMATGDLDWSDEKVKEIGATGVILKPFNIKDIIKLIEKS